MLSKPHVVERIFDLAGYRAEVDLGAQRVLETSCGHGAFLVFAEDRVMTSERAHGRPVSELEETIAAFDVDESHVLSPRDAVCAVLERHLEETIVVASLAARWVGYVDFLLTPIQGAFDFVVGNMPYICVEQIALEIQYEYRRRYFRIFDIADLYVAFIESGVSLFSVRGDFH